MGFPKNVSLLLRDNVNDLIWKHLHTERYDALDILNPNKFGIVNIKKEIGTGCSPCPDVLTEGFGTQPSILFVSTVYGLVHKYLRRNYNRLSSSWNEYVNDFYRDIIYTGIGIYHRLSEIYELVVSMKGNNEFWVYRTGENCLGRFR